MCHRDGILEQALNVPMCHIWNSGRGSERTHVRWNSGRGCECTLSETISGQGYEFTHASQRQNSVPGSECIHVS